MVDRCILRWLFSCTQEFYGYDRYTPFRVVFKKDEFDFLDAILFYFRTSDSIVLQSRSHQALSFIPSQIIVVCFMDYLHNTTGYNLKFFI